jgi:hypothetical protein
MLAYRPMKRLVAAAGTLAILLTHAAGKKEEIVVGVALEPHKIHEECQRVAAGDKRKYHWKSSAPVDFNIHYHRGPEVFYPVKREAMRGDGGTFDPKTGEDYCWMWTARDKPAKVEARIEK